ncbi:ATP-binding protein [uncultured Eubacterium sp.]|uniref:ATP-binding protein n=1 Tax=uncultured Eubacterium sp. TaxID=165185 RepID=UPI0025CC07DD|nr:ATP-binding protein [uncultured Eubacterium sp.]
MPLTNTQYDQIMRGYQDRQLERQRLIDTRREEIATVIPEIAKLDADIASLSVKRARQLLDGDASALEDLHEQIQALSLQKQQLLQAHGYPADYFQPPYTCPDCQDTGYIGHERCHCLKQAAIDLVYTQSNLKGILEQENFSSFSLDYYDNDIYDDNTRLSSYEAAQNALLQCRRFADTFDSSFENLLLFGDTGVGKTFLSNCVAKELLDTGHSVIYFSAHHLFDLLAQKTFAKDPQAAESYRNIFDCDLLIIDDLGTELTNHFTTSQFFVCLNERIRKEKSTLISTNLQLFDIATIYSERIFSRISNSFTILHLFGKDIRICKKLAEK